MAGRIPSSVVALLLIGIVPLAGCSPHLPTPPPLTETDLHDAVAMDLAGYVPQRVDLLGDLATLPGMCVDLHRGRSRIDFVASGRDRFAKLLMRLGLRGGLTHWREPGPGEGKPVAAILERRLGSASGELILQSSAAPGDRASDKSWPGRCTRRYWLAAPVYEGEFAFVERGSVCGGLCGAGAILALEYRGGRWHTVGVHGTWIA
jgi:hypothetical protein